MKDKESIDELFNWSSALISVLLSAWFLNKMINNFVSWFEQSKLTDSDTIFYTIMLIGVGTFIIFMSFYAWKSGEDKLNGLVMVIFIVSIAFLAPIQVTQRDRAAALPFLDALACGSLSIVLFKLINWIFDVYKKTDNIADKLAIVFGVLGILLTIF